MSKYLKIRDGFYINKKRIIGIERDNINQFMSNIYMTDGNLYRADNNYQTIVDILEQEDNKQEQPRAITPYDQFNAA